MDAVLERGEVGDPVMGRQVASYPVQSRAKEMAENRWAALSTRGRLLEIIALNAQAIAGVRLCPRDIIFWRSGHSGPSVIEFSVKRGGSSVGLVRVREVIGCEGMRRPKQVRT